MLVIVLDVIIKHFGKVEQNTQLKKNTLIWFPKLYPNGEWDNKISDMTKTYKPITKIK